MSELKEAFEYWIGTDSKVKTLWDKMQKTADPKLVEQYANLVGTKWSKLLTDAYGNADTFDENSIVEAVKRAYSESAYFAKSQINVLCKKLGIGLKSKMPAIDSDRVDSYVDKLKTEDAKWLFGKDVMQNIARAGSNDAIKMNARRYSEAGLTSYIERVSDGKCCDWCESMVGRYKYGEQPDDFFQMHKDCTCNIIYTPSKGKTQRIRYEGGRRITD